MKPFYTLVITVLLLFTNSCIEGPNHEPDYIGFHFSILDSQGNDLFFGPDSQYNPYDVIFGINQDSDLIYQYWFNIIDSSHFLIDGILGRINDPYEIFVQFIPQRIDTFNISYSVDANVKDDIFEFDVFFNSLQICIDCASNKTYEIYLK